MELLVSLHNARRLVSLHIASYLEFSVTEGALNRKGYHKYFC